MSKMWNKMWNKLILRWWRKHNVCVFCNDGADLNYNGVPICAFCLCVLADKAKEVQGDE